MKRFLLFANLIVLFVTVGLPLAKAENISRVEGLNRVGAADPATGYPHYYEDRSGLRLSVCSNFTHCFLALPDPTAPLYFPDSLDPVGNFPDEVFYYVAEAQMIGLDTKVRSIVSMAVEGAFFNGEVIDGDQITFSRVRMRVDNLVLGREYKVTYPYGKHTFIAPADAGPGANPGPGLSLVRDIGIQKGDFTGVLYGDVGPFLIPTRFSDANGNFVGGINHNGSVYISDAGLTLERVTGSPLGTNFVRIEGLGIGDAYPVSLHCTDALLGPDPLATNDCIQTDLFSMQGQIAETSGLSVSRATYGKTAEGVYVNVWADSIPEQYLVASVDGGAAIQMTEGVDGNYFIRMQVIPPSATPATAPTPHSVTVYNLSDAGLSAATKDISDHLTVTAEHVIGAGLTISATSSNVYDPIGATAHIMQADPLLPPIVLNLTDLPENDGVATGSVASTPLTMSNPGFSVVVNSTLGGSAETSIDVAGVAVGESTGVIANAGTNVSGQTGGQTVVLNGANSVGPTNMSYAWTHNDLTGLITLNNANQAQANFVTPMGTEPAFPASGLLEVDFTLTVTDPANPGASSSAVVRGTINHPTASPFDSCPIVDARYKVGNGRWDVVGTCNFASDPAQKISIYPGDAFGPNLSILLGETYAIPGTPVIWDFSPGNNSAPVGTPQAGALADETPTYTHVWAISEQGSAESSTYSVQ